MNIIAGIPSLGSLRSLALPLRGPSRSAEVGERLAPGDRAFIWDVRAKLLLYSLIIILPVIIFTTNVIQQSFSSTRDQILRGEMVRADRVSLQLDSAVRTGETILTALAATPQVQGRQTDETTQLLCNALELDTHLAGLAAVDASGLLFATAGDALPDSAGFHGFLQRVMVSGERAVFAQVNPSVSRPAAIIAVPFRGVGGQQGGALGAVLRLDSLVREIADPGNGDRDGMLLVVDRAGAPVMALDRGMAVERSVQGLGPLQTALNDHTFLGEYSDPYNNKSWLGAALPPSRYGWVGARSSRLASAVAAPTAPRPTLRPTCTSPALIVLPRSNSILTRPRSASSGGGPAVAGRPAAGPPVLAAGAVWSIDLGGGVLYGLDPASGAVRFKGGLPAPARNFSTPAADAGHLYAPTGSQIAAFVIADH